MLLDNYPPGAASDPRAPYNQREPDEDWDGEGCPNPSRRCGCEDCQSDAADAAYDEDR